MASVPIADLVFRDGRVLTADGWGEALAVRRGRIVAVGRDRQIRRRVGPTTEVVDLKGKPLLPGFIDAHTHLVSQGLKETGYYLDLSHAPTPGAVLEQVRQAVRERGAGAWVRGRGWDESRWPDANYLTRRELDRVAPRNPVALSRVDGHLLVANTRALELVTLDAPPDEFDRERGLLRERAVDQFHRQISPDEGELEAAILAGVEKAHALGVTCVHDVVSDRHMRAYQRLHRRGELHLRVRMNPLVEHLPALRELGAPSGVGDDVLRRGALKIFADGSIGARNAALTQPYADGNAQGDGRGKLNYSNEELLALVRRVHGHGFQLMIHAIGDRAIGQALEALQRAGVGPGDRARIEHFELPTQEHLKTAEALGVVASMQPNFLQWSGPGGLYERRLGPERDSRIDPHRAVCAWGIALAFGSDMMPFGPLYGLHLAAHAPHAGQRLSGDEALHAYTSGAAYAGFDEEALGSLEPGKWADLIVLAGDPTADPERITELDVVETYLAGERVYPASV